MEKLKVIFKCISQLDKSTYLINFSHESFILMLIEKRKWAFQDIDFIDQN